MNGNYLLISKTAALIIQIGIILFAVRLIEKPAQKFGIPPMLGGVLAGIILGPFALGGISLPGFQSGIFPAAAGIPAVSTELYAFAVLGAVILFFTYGLETNIVLFLRYSIAGSVVGIGGVILSFLLGDFCGVILLKSSFFSPQCLFLGITATTTSAGITARILLDRKKMDSPEGVTILAAAVFDDMLGIIGLKIVLVMCLLMIAGKTDPENNPADMMAKFIGIWIGATVLVMVFSKRISRFLQRFRHPYDFPIMALGIAFLLAGIFEKQGSAMVIGAYIAGLFLSKTEIAAEIKDRLHGMYHFFVPFLFFITGMMVDYRVLFTAPFLFFAFIYTLAAIAAKIIGCGVPARLIGFNLRGSLRIGTGMIPRDEVALVMAGTGLVLGYLEPGIFEAIILMTFLTSIAASPMINASFALNGKGTRKQVKGDDSVSAVWNFPSREITGLTASTLLENLRKEGFYVQILNIDDGLSQARKYDISISITEKEKSLNIETARTDMPYVKNAVNKVTANLCETVQKLRTITDPAVQETGQSGTFRTTADLLSLISPDCISLTLKGETKGEILAELTGILYDRGRIHNSDQVLNDLLEREKIMSTGMQHGIALPHAKTDGAYSIAAAIGIKKDGVDFESADGSKSKIFIMIVSPRRTESPHIQLLSALSLALKNEKLREDLLNASNPMEAAAILQNRKTEPV